MSEVGRVKDPALRRSIEALGTNLAGDLTEINNKLDTILADVEAQGGIFVPSQDWAEADLPTALASGTLYSYLFKGDLFVSGSNAESGIWRVNKEARRFDKVHQSGNSWNNFIEAGGKLFVTSTTSPNILQWNEDTALFDVAHEGGYNWSGRITIEGREYWFPRNGNYSTFDGGLILFDHDTGELTVACPRGFGITENSIRIIEKGGNIYLTDTNSYFRGLWRLDRDTGIFDEVYATGYYWDDWYEFNGKWIVGSTNAGPGLLVEDLSTDTFKVAYNTGSRWTNRGVVDGKLYLSSTSYGNILCLDEETLTFTIVKQSSGAYIEAIMHDGNMFLSSNSSSNPGIVMISPEGVSDAYAEGYRWNNWYEFGGKLFVSSTYTTNSVGLLCFDPATSTFTQAWATGYGWTFKEFGEKLLAVTNSTSNSGIICFDPGTSTFTQAWATGYYWNNWYEFGGKLLVSSTYTTNSVGLLCFDPSTSTFTQAWATGYYWNNWYEFEGKLFISASSSSAGILCFDPDTSTTISVFSAGNNFSRFFEFKDNLFVSSSNTSYSGMFRYNKPTKLFVQVASSGYDFNVQREIGNICVAWSSGINYGFVVIKADGSAVQSVTSGRKWDNWIEGTVGGVLISSSDNSSDGSSYSRGLYYVDTSSGTVSNRQYYGRDYKVFHETEKYLFIATRLGDANAYAVRVNKDNLGSNNFGFYDMDPVNVGEYFGCTFFASKPIPSTTANAFRGLMMISADGETVIGYTSGYAWRPCAVFNGAVYFSSAYSPGIIRATPTQVTLFHGSGYAWGNPVVYNDKLYLSATKNEAAKQSYGLLRLEETLDKFDPVFGSGLDYSIVTTTEGDHWVSDSYDHIFAILSGGLLVEGYQSGPIMDFYTVNRHGIVEVTDEAVKHQFTSKFEMPDTLTHLDDDGKYFIFSKGSVIFNTAA
jgi:hypothetical protein